MKITILSGLVIFALGSLAGVFGYKRLNPVKPTTAVSQEAEASSTVRTIEKRLDKRGNPVIKETVSSNTTKSTSKTTAPPPSRKNIVGLNASVDAKGQIKAGPLIGRELIPNMYVTGGVMFNLKGPSEPAITAGVIINF
jgi:hypothetical protein